MKVFSDIDVLILSIILLVYVFGVLSVPKKGAHIITEIFRYRSQIRT